MSRAIVGRAVAAALVACAPDLGPGDSIVTGTRVLAVRAEPAEAKPGDHATFTPLVATTAGTNATAAVVWDFCHAPKPLTENDDVSTACLSAAGLVGAGVGPMLAAAMPSDACSLFGPDPPPGGYRARDPDVTGGYYQPLRAAVTGAPLAFDLVRVRCDLANAGASAAAAFALAYVANTNPHLLPLAARAGGQLVALVTVAVGVHLALEASWPASDAETYALFDAASQSITTQRESMRVAWYATGGTFDTESTGRAADDLATTSDNGWTAPSTPGTVHLWIVLRDSRGGVDFASYDVVAR